MRVLQVFYEVTLQMSHSLVSTFHTTFYAVIKIETAIKNWVPPGSSVEVSLKQMTINMRAKYDKYFDSYVQLNLLLMIAFIFDPRFKLRHATHLLSKQVSEVGPK